MNGNIYEESFFLKGLKIASEYSTVWLQREPQKIVKEVCRSLLSQLAKIQR